MTGKARAAAFAAVVTLSAASAAASAHNSPARRSIVVQAEANEVVILVSWTAPTGILGKLMIAGAAWGRSNAEGLRALKARAAERALAPLEVELDGAPLALKTAGIKLATLDGRPSVAVLLTAEISSAAHSLRVEVDSREASRILWTDKSDGAMTASRKTPPDQWATGQSPLYISWKRR